MSKQAIIDAAGREVSELDDDDRDKLGEAVSDHVQTRIVAAVRHCLTVAECLGYNPEILHPEAVAWLAAVLTIPADATHPPSDDHTHDEPVD